MPLPIVQASPGAAHPAPKVFLSYSSEDGAQANTFVKHFKVWLSGMRIDEENFFYDADRLTPGGEWQPKLFDELDKSDVVVFLVSVNSLQPNGYCMAQEIPRAAKAGIPIVPVVLANCLWMDCPVPGHPTGVTFGALGALPPRNGGPFRPVSQWTHADDAWTEVLDALKRTLSELSPRASAPPTPRPRAVTLPRDVSGVARTDLLPYLCNQDKAEDDFRDGIREWDRRALVVLVKGVYDDNLEKFWERLRVELLSDCVEQGPHRGPPLNADRPLVLPKRYTRGRKFKEEMERDLLGGLSKILTGRALSFDTADALAAEMRKQPGVISLLAIPPAGADSPGEGVAALLRLFEKLPEDVCARTVVVVSLEDAALGSDSVIAAWQLRHRVTRSLVIELAPLRPVDQRDARVWHQARQIESRFRLEFQDVMKLFDGADSSRLRTFAARIQPLLQQSQTR